MNHPAELEVLLEGVDSEEARGKIVAAYHSLSGADPGGFAVQFAILGAAIAGRIERAVPRFQDIPPVDGGQSVNASAIAEEVSKAVPSIRDMKQLADALKLSVNHMNRDDGRKGGAFWISAFAAVVGLLNALLLGYLLFELRG